MGLFFWFWFYFTDFWLFGIIFELRCGIDFFTYFDAFWEPCWFILGIVLNFAKKALPHESAINSSQIDGPAPWKSRKKRKKNEGKTAGERRWKKSRFLLDFGSILGGFGDHFGSQNAFKNRVKFWMRFWRRKEGGPGFFGVGRAECAGPWGG